MAAILPPGSELPELPELPPPPPDEEDPFAIARAALGLSPENDAVELVQIGDQTMELNMGPQHPSTHGVLRLVLDLDGEVVKECRPDIGFLHTGFEKSFESHTYQQCIPLTDRMDYLAPPINNFGFSLAVEKLLGIVFTGHHDLRRILMPDDWEGHPLRKDYVSFGEPVAFTHNIEWALPAQERPPGMPGSAR